MLGNVLLVPTVPMMTIYAAQLPKTRAYLAQYAVPQRRPNRRRRPSTTQHGATP